MCTPAFTPARRVASKPPKRSPCSQQIFDDYRIALGETAELLDEDMISDGEKKAMDKEASDLYRALKRKRAEDKVAQHAMMEMAAASQACAEDDGDADGDA